jgi:hypothetical protein
MKKGSGKETGWHGLSLQQFLIVGRDEILCMLLLGLNPPHNLFSSRIN